MRDFVAVILMLGLFFLGLWIVYVIGESDLPLWVKLWLLR